MPVIGAEAEAVTMWHEALIVQTPPVGERAGIEWLGDDAARMLIKTGAFVRVGQRGQNQRKPWTMKWIMAFYRKLRDVAGDMDAEIVFAEVWADEDRAAVIDATYRMGGIAAVDAIVVDVVKYARDMHTVRVLR